MLSIIIPTLNEQEYLPLLLKSIKGQNFNDYEIIIADAGSKDRTLEIAKQYDCRVIAGGKPARGRNNGAKAALGDTLFFLDSDTVLPLDFFEKSLSEFKSRKLDIASFCFTTNSKKKIFHTMLDFYNKTVVVLEKKIPFSIIGVFVKKNLFETLGGYDEEITLSEDNNLGRKAAKKGKFGIIRSTEIFISDRRFVKDGWMTTVIKYLLSELHNFFIGPIKSDIFNYKFDHYKDNK